MRGLVDLRYAHADGRENIERGSGEEGETQTTEAATELCSIRRVAVYGEEAEQKSNWTGTPGP